MSPSQYSYEDADVIAMACRAARLLASQRGAGIARSDLVALAQSANGSRVTVLADPEAPAVAVISPPDAGSDPRFAALTARERAVAGLMAEGLTNAQIARRLVIAEGTVKDHVHHVLSKTGLARRSAVAAAWRAT